MMKSAFMRCRCLQSEQSLGSTNNMTVQQFDRRLIVCLHLRRLHLFARQRNLSVFSGENDHQWRARGNAGARKSSRLHARGTSLMIFLSRALCSFVRNVNNARRLSPLTQLILSLIADHHGNATSKTDPCGHRGASRWHH